MWECFFRKTEDKVHWARNIRLAAAIVNLRHLSFSVLMPFKKVLFNFTETDGGSFIVDE